ncbi:MAG: type II toxin-antitoxin system RelE/ParE family toxin [Gammaproteobacteria bacterium]|nr:type II toxin-antitoxin system RelE/ParE family toxin [Gammaproteobacteria bacterium]
MANVNWTRHAISTLDGIYDYLHREAPFYAEHTVRQTIDTAGILQDHPLAGRQVPEAEREDIREVICKGYRVIYWVISDNQLDILGVVHSSRDLDSPRNQSWLGA